MTTDALQRLNREIRGFIVAPLVPPIAFLLFFPEAERVILWGGLFAYFMACIAGIPLNGLLKRYRWTSWPAYVVAASLITMLPFAMFFRLSSFDWFLGFFLVCGAVSGGVFWLIARPDKYSA